MVKSGQTLKVEKLTAAESGAVSFDRVLLTADDDGSNAKVGTPYLSGVAVVGTVLKQGRAKKIRVEKFKRKVRYHKVYGHRQPFTEVKIG